MKYKILSKVAPYLFFNAEEEPIRCSHCFSKNLNTTVDNLFDSYYGPVSEFHVNCGDCGVFITEWAYGSYNPCCAKPPSWGDIF